MNQIRVPIDFIFDEQGIVGEDSAMWYGFIRAMLPEELKPLLGSRPIFKNDKELIPLQAADMLAWHLRRSREERYAGEIRPALSHLRKDQHLECWVPDEMLEHWASEYAQIPGVAEMKTKKTSIRGTMVDIESELARMPVEDKPYERFDAAMKQILSVSKAELQRRMEAEKQSKATASHVPASHAKRD